MAFCPNCGTPNTDQAEKCVSCSFDLAPKPKGRFKGTIMMQGTQLPDAAKAPTQPAPQAAPPPEATQPAQIPARPSGPAGGKNMAFEKTMMGGAGLPPAGAFGTPGPASSGFGTGGGQGDLGRAPTVEGPRPAGFGSASDSRGPAQASGGFGAGSPAGGFSTPSAGAFGAESAGGGPSPGGFGGAGAGFGGASSQAPSGFGNTGGNFSGGGTGGSFGNAGGGSAGGGFGNTGGFANTGSGFGKSAAPTGPNTKMIALGCGGALVLTIIVAIVLYMVGSNRPGGLFGDGGRDNAAAEWRGSLSTALVQVAALCQSDCQAAAVYFHQDVQAALLDQAKLLTPARATKLADPTQSEAHMLDQTDDAALAEKLKLDPAQCVRVATGTVKVVGCSVPTPGGRANLRIVHLEGVGSL